MGDLSTAVFSDSENTNFSGNSVQRAAGRRAFLPCVAPLFRRRAARSRRRQQAAAARRPSPTRFLRDPPSCECAAGCTRSVLPPQPCRTGSASGGVGLPTSFAPVYRRVQGRKTTQTLPCRHLARRVEVGGRAKYEWRGHLSRGDNPSMVQPAESAQAGRYSGTQHRTDA